MIDFKIQLIKNLVQECGLLIPIDVLVVGATGAGKSSTLNALFGSEVSSVGNGVEPETQSISSSELHEYFRFHDSAGLGDGVKNDAVHSRNIVNKLRQSCSGAQNHVQFIDLVLVILDGSTRDLGTSYKLIEQVIAPEIDSSRIMIAINQADIAMKGRYWDRTVKQPKPELQSFLKAQAGSVRQRVNASTGCTINEPVSYSAAEKYNIQGLLNDIIKHIPSGPRLKQSAI